MQMERDTETKAERAEMEARLEAKLETFRQDAERQRQQFEDLRLEVERAKHQEELQRIKSNALQVSMLQSRLEALHNAKLLTVRDCCQSTAHWLIFELSLWLLTRQDEEMFALEDIIADSFEGHDDEDKASSVVACQKVASLVALCGRIASDPALARQLRRKHAQW